MTPNRSYRFLPRFAAAYAIGLLALALAACGGGGGSGTSAYTLGGTVSGLTGIGLVVQTGTASLNIAANATSFTFTNTLTGGYNVTILSQPTGETCTVANGSGGGTSGTPVTSVSIACRPYAVYVANQTGSSIAHLNIGSDGTLSAAAGLSTPNLPDSIVICSDGQHGWVAYQDDNLISNLAIDGSGNMSLQNSTSSALSAQDTLALSADGKSLFAAENGAAMVSQFSIGSGGLASTSPGKSVAAGINPGALAATPDGTKLYVANASANTISGYSLSSSGVPTALATASFSTTNYGTNPKGLAVNPSTGAVYVTLADSAKVVQYLVDSTTGALTFHASQSTGTTPRGIAISPSGSYAYVANYAAGTVSQYTLAGGSITPLSTPTVAAGLHPTAIAISPDGGYAYVTNFGDGTISQYSISAAGLLTPLSPATVSSQGAGPVALAVR